MQIIVVGCGKVGHTLAERLSGEGHNLVLVDLDAKLIQEVTDELDVMGVVGNVVEVETSYIREYNTQYAAHILGYVQAMSDADMEKYRPGKENSTYDYDTKVGKDGV